MTYVHSGKYVLQKAKCIISQPEHPLWGEFILTPRGRCYAAGTKKKKTTKNQASHSFIPLSIRQTYS